MSSLDCLVVCVLACLLAVLLACLFCVVDVCCLFVARLCCFDLFGFVMVCLLVVLSVRLLFC